MGHRPYRPEDTHAGVDYEANDIFIFLKLKLANNTINFLMIWMLLFD